MDDFLSRGEWWWLKRRMSRILGPFRCHVVLDILQKSAPNNLESLFAALGRVDGVVVPPQKCLEKNRSDRECWCKDDAEVGDVHLCLVGVGGDPGEMVAEVGEDDIVGTGESDEDTAEVVADLAIRGQQRLELFQEDGRKKGGRH